jgi:hypothetical protein
VVVGLIAFAGVIGATLVLLGRPEQSSRITLPAPTPEIAVATKEYLAGPGRPIDQHDATGGLARELKPTATPAECGAAASALDEGRDGPPQELLLAIQSIPDDLLRELIVGEYAAEMRLLSACGSSDAGGMSDLVKDLSRFHDAVMARRASVATETGAS